MPEIVGQVVGGFGTLQPRTVGLTREPNEYAPLKLAFDALLSIVSRRRPPIFNACLPFVMYVMFCSSYRFCVSVFIPLVLPPETNAPGTLISGVVVNGFPLLLSRIY